MLESDDKRASRQVLHMLSNAIQERASDVHFESRPDRLRIRFRIDGVLVEQSPLAPKDVPAVINRLKILASMDIAERRVPQDGGFSQSFKGADFNFRVSSFPADGGEKIVVRLLQPKVNVNLDALGMPSDMAERLREIISHPQGMVLVTGPTGSGKTSSLYAMIRFLETERVNIMTLEDPIEYRFNHVIQAQIHPRAGFTFASGLRAILRQDPDIILVGEMRDGETADTAFKAALTGHLVLSSLHTNSAVETVVRLVDMGVERFVVASALRAIIGQRLVRRLCQRCRVAYEPDDAIRQAVELGDEPATLYRAVGCHWCNFSGYEGRVGIFELVDMDDDLQDLIRQEQASRNDYKALISRRSLPTIRRAGFARVRDGSTSLEEVYRVT